MVCFSILPGSTADVKAQRHTSDWAIKHGVIGVDGYNTGLYERKKSENTGQAVRLDVLNLSNDESFRLFRLPPGARIEFQEYMLQTISGKLPPSFKMWIANRITVNGKGVLEKWLPYQTLSDQKVFISKGTSPENLDFDVKTSKQRTDYNKEPVRRLDIDLTGSFIVPIKGLN